MTLRVLGVDPGTAVTGYGVVDLAPGRIGTLIECGVVRTPARAPLPDRLRALHDGVGEVIERHHPAVLAVESVFVAKNVRSTIALGHARGVILLAAALAGVDVAEFAPRAIKKAVVGTGDAQKPQVAFMVQQLLRLQRPPAPSDAADAVAVALTYLLTSRLQRA